MSVQDHIWQAKRNEWLAQHLWFFAPEWACIVLFYAAVRYALALEIALGWAPSGTHWQRMRRLKDEGFANLANAYRRAYLVSCKWRYEEAYPHPPQWLAPPLPAVASDYAICQQCAEAFKAALRSRGVPA